MQNSISLLDTHSSELQPAGNGRKVWWSGSEKTRGIDKKGKNDCQMLRQLQQRNKMCGAAIVSSFQLLGHERGGWGGFAKSRIKSGSKHETQVSKLWVAGG